MTKLNLEPRTKGSLRSARLPFFCLKESFDRISISRLPGELRSMAAKKSILPIKPLQMLFLFAGFDPQSRESLSDVCKPLQTPAVDTSFSTDLNLLKSFGDQEFTCHSSCRHSAVTAFRHIATARVFQLIVVPDRPSTIVLASLEAYRCSTSTTGRYAGVSAHCRNRGVPPQP